MTSQPGPSDGLRAQLGFGPDGSDPADNTAWTWVEAAFNTDASNNDEFVASLLPEATGTFDYAYRYSTSNGRAWIYADLNGIADGYSAAQAGNLTVNPGGDTSAPSVPIGLTVVSASLAGVQLTWDAIAGDPSLYGYEVSRGGTAGGPYSMLARVTGNSDADTDEIEGQTYYYVVRSLDTSFNRSADSNEVAAVPQLRMVDLTLVVTVPELTPPDKLVHIAGTLSRLGKYPDWNSSAVAFSADGPNQWAITFTAPEGTQIEYKYTLGGTNFFDVEKGEACAEIGNRLLTLPYGDDGNQTVNDTVLNWRNVLPCGN
ncbi:MAG TPA: hypothetical protein VK897_08830 [Anaerolineales bacterium]|nr:hypothetical protein [Anaerolineales bacterium]